MMFLRFYPARKLKSEPATDLWIQKEHMKFLGHRYSTVLFCFFPHSNSSSQSVIILEPVSQAPIAT